MYLPGEIKAWRGDKKKAVVYYHFKRVYVLYLFKYETVAIWFDKISAALHAVEWLDMVYGTLKHIASLRHYIYAVIW